MIVSILRILSVLLSIVGSSFILPIFVAFFLNERKVIPAFIFPMIFSFIFALIVNFVFRRHKIKISGKFTFLSVALSWIFTSLFGAVPLYFSGSIPNFTDAVFESVSGFTTTGSTILQSVECLPRSINLYRCQICWLGGLGIVGLTVALLPLLGVGGFKLVKAETTGPEKGKMTPKIATTVKLLWIIYLSLTASQTVLLRLSGMDFIDAISHAFSCLGTGGFSTRDGSIASFNSPLIDSICIIFMFLGSVNFSLYYYILIKEIDEIKRNSEFKALLLIVVFCSLSVSIFCLSLYRNFFTSLRYGIFQVVSIMSTTGLSNADYTSFPMGAQFFILLLFFTGGSSGSTSGGIKIIRWVIMAKCLVNENKKLLHPHAVFPIRINGEVARGDLVSGVASFIFLYFLLILLTTFFGALAGFDFLSASTSALTFVGNVGPAFGKFNPASSFASVPSLLKWWYSFVMLSGRLELYTMLIFFSKSWWKK